MDRYANGGGETALLTYSLVGRTGQTITMSRNTSISLGDHFTSFVDQQVAEGRHGPASEVVRAGLRLEEHEIRLNALRAALIEGEESGTAEPFDFECFLKDKRGRHPG